MFKEWNVLSTYFSLSYLKKILKVIYFTVQWDINKDIPNTTVLKVGDNEKIKNVNIAF